ncbi:hemolysin family protein [Nocardia zapadnayensis]|uniref:Hemolysin family protein n=1 Tax=Brevibacterium pityocampae TaxID=506594 RepID=A0ABP8JU65_9MICO|nr:MULTISPECIES: hemolysin family protein [Actinomycetes]MCK1802092.1 hemolysin family protein [Brevibacterium sp. R8603A2]MCX0278436.1 hemolysin family protein [Nocardia zapadnayensis]
MSDGVAILVLILLLAGNAFFVGAEFAMVSARRDQIEPKAAEGSQSARWTLRGITDVSVSLAATQLGITACSLLIGAVGEPAIAHLIEGPLESWGVPGGLVHPIALVIALLIVTFLHMVLGEMVPKNMAIAKPAAAALLLGPVLRVFVVVFRPFIWLMNTAANLVVTHVLRAEPKDEVSSSFSSGEVLEFVAESGREGLLGEEEIRLLTGALKFEELTAADVALAPGTVRTIPRTATVAEVEQLCIETGFSRFPVTDGSGGLVGYVHAKDLLVLGPEERLAALPDTVIRELGAVPGDAKLRRVMVAMQRTNSHMALIDGGPRSADEVAVVALEDVLEELVGEVRDATSPV